MWGKLLPGFIYSSDENEMIKNNIKFIVFNNIFLSMKFIFYLAKNKCDFLFNLP
ncbi:hypothetical protein XSR1_230053 [Xenorhabdus szentirmaii DSM 16338]|uniref:Uncharacterized protein n=1 Tax=Xenorhabdus szentirmaii DSM 16338 TaxID=1427518 RepID=W1IYN8_9GAMM|nr:hypothetical protein XSR1_230053 [Xenorhabdus szentirmaii DSM 16338]